MAYDPDLVVVGYCLNDSEEEGAAELRRARDWQEWTKQRTLRDMGVLKSLGAVSTHRGAAPCLAGEPFARACLPLPVHCGLPGLDRSQGRARANGRSVSRASNTPRRDGLPALRQPAGRPVSVHADPRSDRSGHRRNGLGETFSICCRRFGGSSRRCLVVDGANDEHPNEIAQRIAAQTLAAALTDVLPSAETAATAHHDGEPHPGTARLR